MEEFTFPEAVQILILLGFCLLEEAQDRTLVYLDQRFPPSELLFYHGLTPFLLRFENMTKRSSIQV